MTRSGGDRMRIGCVATTVALGVPGFNRPHAMLQPGCYDDQSTRIRYIHHKSTIMFPLEVLKYVPYH